MRLAFIGDLHLDSKNIGLHKDYYQVCKNICEDITEFIHSKNISHLFFLGDIANKDIKGYSGLNKFLSYFSEWNRILNGNVYSIRGNHDFGDTPRLFQILETTGLIKTYIDDSEVCNFKDFGRVRVHFMNYGETTKKLNTENADINVLISHDYWITSNETVLKKNANIISDTENIKDIDYIINGHIHTPSKDFIVENNIHAINAGCPSRPTKRNNIWSEVFFPYIDINESDNSFNGITLYRYTLPNSEDIFYDKIETDNSLRKSIDSEELRNILSKIQNIQNTDMDTLYKQVHILAGEADEVAKIIINALKKYNENI